MVIDVYAAMADGVWLYDPKQHALRLHLGADIRARTGMQDFVATAPLNLVYVVHGERMKDVSREDRRLYGSVDAAFAGQTSISTVRRRGSLPYSAGRSTTKSSGAPCSSERAVRCLRPDGRLSAGLTASIPRGPEPREIRIDLGHGRAWLNAMALAIDPRQAAVLVYGLSLNGHSFRRHTWTFERLHQASSPPGTVTQAGPSCRGGHHYGGEEADLPFEEGAHDTLDPNLRHRMISEAGLPPLSAARLRRGV